MLHSFLALMLAVQPPAGATVPTAYQVLQAEYARGTDTRVLDAALASRDTVLQRLAVRAFGRMERKEFAAKVVPMMESPAVTVRREALNALAQLGAGDGMASRLDTEKEPSVRAAIYEAMGRVVPVGGRGATPPAPAATIARLTSGLTDVALTARVGAARGLEAAVRRTGRGVSVDAAATSAMHAALRANVNAELRQLVLLAMTAAGDRDSATVRVALADTSAQVRRLAVALSREWVNDPAPMVRYQALRVAGTCERAVAALRDTSDHVVLTAVDLLGEKNCGAALIDSLVQHGNWRLQSHALVALAKVDPARAKASMPKVATSAVWQARAWAAQAAKVIKDTATLTRLARDTAPNVAIAAMTTDADALRALGGSHSGLVLAAANHFKGASGASRAAVMTDALLRLSAKNVATNRDPRVALLQRLLESADSATAVRVAPLARDLDPSVAALAAQVVSTRAHIPTIAATTAYQPAPFPTAAALAALHGATARMTIKGLGVIELELLPDEAAATVATFVDLANRRAYNGLTWHRIVPNFVLQGGSPGADEYDGITSTFMRDEVGYARHARGTFGISTRGRDTGDGQIFINLVDNFRLDHDYSVFARITKGLNVMDRVQEGDVIESVTIVRRAR